MTALQPLPNANLGSIEGVDQALGLIDENLGLLAQGVAQADLTDRTNRAQLVANIRFLRQYFVAAERALLREVAP